MTKAFTKESDLDLPEVLPDEYTPPPGGKNFLTPEGYKNLHEELRSLHQLRQSRSGEKPITGAKVPEPGTRELERRIRYLTSCLSFAEVIDAAGSSEEEVSFGATVVVRSEDGACKSYRIVGIEEADIGSNLISWVSPLGTALLKARVGDFVTYAAPRGERELEIMEIRHELSG